MKSGETGNHCFSRRVIPRTAGVHPSFTNQVFLSWKASLGALPNFRSTPCCSCSCWKGWSFAHTSVGPELFTRAYRHRQVCIGKYSGEMMEWLAERGHEVRVVTAPPYYPAWKVREDYRWWEYRVETSPAGVRVFRCPLWVPERPNGIRRMLHWAPLQPASSRSCYA